MAGRGTISVNQTPAYGDKSKLAAASKTLTKTPMTGVTVPAPSAGRPAGTGAAPQAGSAPPAGVSQTGNSAQSGNTAQVDPDTQAALNDLAQAFRTFQFWQNVLQQYPSEWSKMYARDAQKNYEQVKLKTRNATPFFE